MIVNIPTEINLDEKTINEIIEGVIDVINFGLNQEIVIDNLIKYAPYEYETLIHSIGKKLLDFKCEKE